MQFYDILEQTKYKIHISGPKQPEDLSDLFVTHEELESLIGWRYRGLPPGTDTTAVVIFRAKVGEEAKAWCKKLVASGKKTLRIDDADLLEILKENYLSDFTKDTKFGRHGDRVCYARRWKRKKTKPTQTDVNTLWNHLSSGFYDKFGTYPPHIQRYNRHLQMFNAFKKIVGWRLVRKRMHKTNVKFFRQIWDNPQEYIK